MERGLVMEAILVSPNGYTASPLLALVISLQ